MNVTLNAYNNIHTKQRFTSSANKSNVAFEGLTGKFFDKTEFILERKCSGVIEKIADITKPFCTWAGKEIKDKAGKPVMKDGSKVYNIKYICDWIPASLSCWITGFYVTNTMKNKHIEKDRKKTLAINMICVAIISAMLGKGVKKVVELKDEAFKEAVKNLKDERILHKAWADSKNLATNVFAFRFLGPVLAVPLADRISKVIDKNKKEKAAGQPLKG